MTGDGFRFAGIDGHIAQVEAHAARMEQVVAAARPLDHGAYGLIGQLFTASVSAAALEAAASVRRIGSVGSAHADALRWCRDAYLEADRRADADVAALDGGSSATELARSPSDTAPPGTASTSVSEEAP